VKTEGWEVEACGGTHLKNTGEIGFIKILHTERIQDGVERIVFSAGLQALMAIQYRDALLTRLSEKMNAPFEKLESTVDRLIRELKASRPAKELLSKEFGDRKAPEYLNKAEQIGKIKFITEPVWDAKDVNSLIYTGSQIARLDSNSVSVLGAIIDNNARITVSVGPGAIDVGINAQEIAKITGSILGGSGSGRQDFAQAGGPLAGRENIEKALQKAKETIRKHLEAK